MNADTTIGILAMLGFMALAYAATFARTRPRTAIAAVVLAAATAGIGLGYAIGLQEATKQENQS